MAFRIATDLLAQIAAEAAASPAVEVCGLLLGHGNTVEEVRSCRNVAIEPSRQFEIDPAALLLAHRQARSGGRAILGCYHSHPSGLPEPSVRDAAEAAPNGWLWLIVAGGEIGSWRAARTGERNGRFTAVVIDP